MTIAQQRTFLTAEWKNLLMLNYVIDPALLQAFVPQGTNSGSVRRQDLREPDRFRIQQHPHLWARHSIPSVV